jgi:hypothetical protein
MPKTRKDVLKILRPYLIGESPREDGEWDMYCPLHEDSNRSAQLNAENGVWFCHAECGGGKVAELIRRKSEWVDPPTAANNGRGKTRKTGQPRERITEARVEAWIKSLHNHESQMNELMGERGLTMQSIKQFEIGWDRNVDAYTIPIRSDDGSFWNIRRYQLNPAEGRRKIWSVEGMGSPRIYPMEVLEDNPEAVLICEGELDAILTNQNGFPCVTRTASAVTWKSEWSGMFKDKVVYLAHDCDKAGQDANRKVGRALQHIAKEVKVIHLGYPITEKHGKDLTDWWHEHPVQEFQTLLDNSTTFGKDSDQEIEQLDPSDANVLESFDSRKVGKPLRMTVTIKGKREPGYSVTKKAHLSCSRDAGPKCNVCPMNGAEGEADVTIDADDPVVLQLLESTKLQVYDVLRDYFGAVKCNRLTIDTEEFQSVEVLYARPSVDHTTVQDGAGGEYKNVKLTSVGRHDTQPNNTVQVTGALYPDPRKQNNEFLAWDVAKLDTSLDTFSPTPAQLQSMKKFQVKKGQQPIKKLREISEDLSMHVTRIYGRPEMHALIDLIFHSAISFDFAGKRMNRGWLEALIVGDTRTGKSEAATMLSRHYQAGEIVSCESASYAGIVGGMQQYGSSKEWAITWGTVPINDRRLVVLDEIGGLSTDEIAAMSSVRSSGLAQLTKIQSEATHARTRLLWLGNPRNAPMSNFTYGVQAIQPLIGNPEDIARFDLAMSVRTGEVPASEINRSHGSGRQRYTAESCRALVRWVWSRKPEQIRWAAGAEDAVYRAAQKLGAEYIEDPPLIQVANVREKIARVAVALAARLYSTDKTGQMIVVKREHVKDATTFIDHLYNMPGFGYGERSKEVLRDAEKATSLKTETKTYLYEKPNLAKFLRNTSSFRRQDIEEVLNVDREQANAVIAHLWEAKMVRKDKGDVRVQPELHELLRELKIK